MTVEGWNRISRAETSTVVVCPVAGIPAAADGAEPAPRALGSTATPAATATATTARPVTASPATRLGVRRCSELRDGRSPRARLIAALAFARS